MSLTSGDETPAPTSSYAQAAASSSIAPTGADAPMQHVPNATGERKRRIVSAEERQELHVADSLVELALIFDTSAGKKGAFGGLGQDARKSTERTINDIVQATRRKCSSVAQLSAPHFPPKPLPPPSPPILFPVLFACLPFPTDSFTNFFTRGRGSLVPFAPPRARRPRRNAAFLSQFATQECTHAKGVRGGTARKAVV